MHAFSAFLNRACMLVATTASAAANPAAPLPSILTETLANATLNATGPNTNPHPKSYRVPNTPITLYFFDYSTPAGLKPASVYQTLVTGLNSVYHSASHYPKTGNSFIGVDTMIWSFTDANIFIENHGTQGSNKLTWTILAGTLLGVGAILEDVGCLQGQWMILDAAWGNIGSGYVGKHIGGLRDGTAPNAGVEAA